MRTPIYIVSTTVGLLMATSAYGQSNEQTESGLLVLNPSAYGALSMTGNSHIEIPAKIVYVNSSSCRAVRTTGTAILDATSLYVVGSASFGGQSECTGTVVTGAPGTYDPLGSTVFPVENESDSFQFYEPDGSGQVTLSPGHYPYGIQITGNTEVVFSPGVFVIGGNGLVVTSGAVSGEGVCLVVNSGEVRLAGSSSMVLTPPEDGAMAGIVLAQPAWNSSPMHLAGGSEFSLTGTIYAPSAELTMVGNSTIQGEGPQMGDLVIADMVDLRGTSLIRIGRENSTIVSLPSLPLYD